MSCFPFYTTKHSKVTQIVAAFWHTTIFPEKELPHLMREDLLFARTPDAKFNLANFMRVHLFTALGALKDGLDILLKEEGVQIDKMYGHGGLFKTPVVGQRIMQQPSTHRFPLWRRQVRAAHGVSRASCSIHGTEGRGRKLADYLSKRVFWRSGGRDRKIRFLPMWKALTSF